MMSFEKLIGEGDLRSIGNSNAIIEKIKNQNSFDELFTLLFHPNRLIVMRAADAIEKLTITKPLYLAKHKKALIKLCHAAIHKELKWHLALLVARVDLEAEEFSNVWELLTQWAKDKTNSKIVRVNSLQSLFELSNHRTEKKKLFGTILNALEKEHIPSIDARIKKLRN